MLPLRPYQSSGIASIREAFGPMRKRAPLYVLPTGGGKTRMFSAIAHGASLKGNRVYILSHRQELIDQISDALEAADTPHGFIAAGYPRADYPVQIASVQTLVRRLSAVAQPDLVIIDEAHHARSDTFQRIISEWPRAKLLGVTATPVRLSGEGLGEIFDTLIVGPPMAELIAQGYLSNYRLFSPPTVDTSGLHRRGGDFIASESEELIDKPAITGSVLQHYREHCDGLPALAFCVSIKHARAVADQFRDAGYSALSIDGGMERGIRRGIVDDFRSGRIKIITSVDLLGEGFDMPGAHVGIFLRPTQSLGLYLQQIGRVLRTAEGKSHAILLDHVGNCNRHGLPDDPRDWQLTYDEESRRTVRKPSVRICAACFCALPSQTQSCPECGYQFPPKPREILTKDGSLVELTPEEIARRAERRRSGFERAQAQTLEQLQEIERRKGYRPGWARHVFEARLAKQQAQS